MRLTGRQLHVLAAIREIVDEPSIEVTYSSALRELEVTVPGRAGPTLWVDENALATIYDSDRADIDAAWPPEGPEREALRRLYPDVYRWQGFDAVEQEATRPRVEQLREAVPVPASDRHPRRPPPPFGVEVMPGG